MTSLSVVHITCRAQNSHVYALLGEKNPVVTDGYGGWSVINRPHRRGLTNWTGRNPFRQEIDLVISEFKRGTSIEPQIVALEKMAAPTEDKPTRTPIVKIHGDALVHRDKEYVIENLTWGVTERNHEKGHRTRQLVTVSLLEYVDGGAVDETNVRPGHGVKKKYRRYTIKRGDDLFKIAQRFLGDFHRWREIAKLNKLHDPHHPPVGKTIRIPPK
jgi:hypothetical protein